MEDFFLINQIGEGSFGKVYKARRKYTGRLVAIKMINKLGQSEDDLTSFRREIDLLKKVSHPNVMKMLSMFETDTDFCVVSELARGDLFQVIDDRQTLPEKALKNIAAQLVSSMAHLHSMHIIHRDLKPQNILVSEKGTIKICDFGFARALSSNTLVLTSVKGTPLYMAPELVQEQPYDEKVDIWALGIILFELFNGEPPFFTNSIYKLVQMIVNSPIVFPDTMSPLFKSFLLEMLQKDPHKRKSADELMNHPFIKDVQLADFDDHVYRFKSEQFERAIQQSLVGAETTFKPKKSKIPDFQMILINPSRHSDEELTMALNFLRQKDISAESPFAASFASHFPAFISRPNVVNEALLVAADLLRKDLDRFAGPFSVGAQLLGTKEMPPAAINFFTELLSLPFSTNIIQNNATQVEELQFGEKKAAILRDRLLSFTYSSDEIAVARTYALMSFFAQETPTILDAMALEFAPQMVPILTSAIYAPPSALIQCAAFCIVSKIIERNNDAIHFVQPFGKFLDAFDQITKCRISTIEQLCVFSCAISFIAIALPVLVEVPDFQNRYSVRQSLSKLHDFLGVVFAGSTTMEERLTSLLEVASLPPKTENEVLCYGCVLSSPFCHIPMKDSFVEPCIEFIVTLVPLHQPSLLETLLALQPKNILPYIPAMVPLFSQPACADALSKYILQVLERPIEETRFMVNSLCEGGVLTMISALICELGPDIPSNVVVCMTQLILTFKEPTEVLLEQTKDILNSIFAVDSAAESALLIASHMARMSKDFLPALSECGALNFAERALQSDIPQIRSKGLDFIGNVCRHTALPDDYLGDFVPLLIDNLSAPEPDCQKLAGFALGNVLFWSPQVADTVVEHLDTIKTLLESTDPRIAENASGVLGNMVRKSDKLLSRLISEGAVKALLETLADLELHGKTILPLSIFCQYEAGRSYLKGLHPQHLISQYTDSPNERIQRYSKKMLQILS